MATNPEAQRRAHILTFWKKHGTKITEEAFGVSRSTLFEWQRRLRERKGKLSALEPRSHRPRNLRGMTTPMQIKEYVCHLRTAFPHYGPAKIRVFLQKAGFDASTSTIWKIIARNNLPAAPRQYVARKKRKKKPRKPADHAAQYPGDLVSMDTIVLQEQGRKKYIITALDHATRIAMAWAYERHSSRQAKDLLLRMQLLLGVPVKAVLTDNGSEFMAHYDRACRDMGITHYWTYPRSPKMNARSERFNRTIQEEARFPVFSASLQEWNAHIGHYVMQYNCHRPHQALAYASPLDQYLSCRTSSSEESRMWAIHTSSSQHASFCVH